ncbi:MAG6410 family transglutaminase-related lipoprotein [Mycoplasmopsis bovigenitalium]|uniref:MAG6410 family transglutaminase-related lipoprotein n=1 Tax=Mycoplasmopsis bovigenitalium TaxID=2112 RepID=UPI000BBA8BBF|nr:transglutaminase domain-containing protein [Mycoplasmopsis bovigenitalium]
MKNIKRKLLVLSGVSSVVVLASQLVSCEVLQKQENKKTPSKSPLLPATPIVKKETKPLTKLTPATPIVNVENKKTLPLTKLSDAKKSTQQNTAPVVNNNQKYPRKQTVDKSEINSQILSANLTGYNYYSDANYHLGFEDNIELKTDQELNLKLLNNSNQEVNGVNWYVRTYYPTDEVYEINQNLNPNSSLSFVAPNIIKDNNNENKTKNVELWAYYQGHLYKANLKIYTKKESKNISEYEQSVKRVKELSKDWHNLSDVQKAKKAYEWLTTNVKYQEGQYLGDDQTAYSAIIQQASVCTGYAKGFKMFMDELNIPNMLITGDVGTERHIWNMVEIEGKWYHVDATWGIRTSFNKNINYNYFLINDYDLKLGRDYIKRFKYEQMGEKYRGIALENFITQREQVAKLVEKQLSPESKTNILTLTTPRNAEFDNVVREGIFKKLSNREKLHISKKQNRNFLTYTCILPRNEDHSKNANIEIEKFANNVSSYILKIKTKNNDVELSNDNVFVQGAFIKKVEKQGSDYLVYLENFDNFGNTKINIEVHKIGYKFNNYQKSFDFDVKRQEMPKAVFNATDSNNGVLTNIDNSMEYRTYNNSWQDVTSNQIKLDNIGTIPISIRKKSSNTHFTSEIQVINIEKGQDLDRIVKYYNGEVVGVDNTMQYRLKNSSDWIDINANKLAKLAQGQYEFRVKPMPNKLASDVFTLTVN